MRVGARESGAGGGARRYLVGVEMPVGKGVDGTLRRISFVLTLNGSDCCRLYATLMGVIVLRKKPSAL